MADVTFIFHSDWLDCIQGLPVEQQDQIIGDIVRYGTRREPQHEDNATVQMGVNFCKSKIDFSVNKYLEKVENGKKNGSKNKKYTDEMIYNAAQGENNSAAVATKLGCSKSTVDHSFGWTRRNEVLNFDGGGNIIT